MNILNKFKVFGASIAVAIIACSPASAAAAPAPINTGAKISFTFDDGLNSAFTQAAPTLAKYGYTGTDYVITNCVGMTTAPNTCHANTDASYMDWNQVTALQNTYGWEVASHTVTHPYLASSDAQDGQPKKLTAAQVTAELTNSKGTLAAHGINATDFASPYGDYNPAVLAQVAKLYASQRGFADTGANTTPYNDYIIRDQQVQAGVSVSTVKSYVDQAVTNKQWLVLTFHDVLPTASTNPDDYQYNTADLDQIAAYVKSKGVSVVNVKDGLINGPNLLTDSTFDNGLANGWTTDAPNYVKKDTANNGSYPNPTNSISLTATTKNVHLFSPKVLVDPNSTYVLKNYLNLTKISSGALGYYIDEYDVNGNWISGQYKLSASFAWPQTVGFEYKPTSTSVSKASVQVIVPANSGALVYVDNFQWMNENGTTTPPPVQENLVANGAFDQGVTGGWSTDSPTNIVADSSNNGSPANPVNSVKMTAGTSNGHLFSPKVPVDPTKTYKISAYVNIVKILTGEVGFYVDEYDASGNWISGKYVAGARIAGTNTVIFDYTPSSANVKSASLQVILTGNSGIVAYVDNINWTLK